MADYEVTCVTIQPGGSDHYAIESLSGTSDDEPWSFDIAEVVERSTLAPSSTCVEVQGGLPWPRSASATCKPTPVGAG